MKPFFLNLSAAVIVGVGLAASPVVAYVASSPNYQIDSDSVNIGGSEDALSASYGLRDTVGEAGTGLASSADYNLHAGYRQLSGTLISISSPGDIALTPTISGVSGGAGSGGASWVVTTNNPTGYSLFIKTNTTPALHAGSDNLLDYAPAGAVPDYAWAVAPNDSRFGFSPKGVDLVTQYLDDGASCGTGGLNTANACWDGLSTTNTLIAQSAAANNPGGTPTTVSFKAEVGIDKLQPAGNYSATVIMTAVTN